MPTAIIPHFSRPFRIVAGLGYAATMEQDSVEDVQTCVRVLLETPVNSRIELPEYGVLDPIFTTGIDVNDLASRIGEWENRAEVDLGQRYDNLDDFLRHVQVKI